MNRTGWISVVVTVLFSGACGGDGRSTDPLQGRAPDGAIRVVVSTSGVDMPTTSYSLRVDHDVAQTVGLNDSVTVRRVASGTHTVRVYGFTSNCRVDGESEREVIVDAGHEVVAAFAISCVARLGDLVISAATAGTELAPNAYSLIIDSGATRQIGANGNVSVRDLHEGNHLVALTALGENCIAAGPNPRSAAVFFRDTAVLRFDVKCAPTGRIRVVTSVSGPDADPDGYTMLIRRTDDSTAATVPTTGAVMTPPLFPGTYTITLRGIAENCDVRGGLTRDVEVVHDATPTVNFDLECAPVTQLAVVRDNQIYLVNSNGTGLVRLTDTKPGVSNIDPAWSPDGKRIAFASNRDGEFEIYVMNADGSNPVRRTNAPINEAPAWSPDGKKIAFSSLRNGHLGIYVMNADDDGSTQALLGFDRGYNAHPAWSPDGRTIAFVSDWRAYDFVYDLYVMNSDGSNVRTLIEGPFFWDDGLTFYFQPAWSPDGKRIAVVVCAWAWDNCFPSSTLKIQNADGVGLTTLAEAGGFARPAWSPDGRTIAFSPSPCRDCPSSLRYARVDGGFSDLIINNAASPAWRPRP